ncbi:serine/threonine protein kinase, partial [Streptomyces sp. NPDC054756]
AAGARAPARPDTTRPTHPPWGHRPPDDGPGGPGGTARVPRAAGAPRPGSARHRAATRRRRLALGGAAVVLVAAAGVGTWLAISDDDAGATPQDTRSTAPATP